MTRRVVRFVLLLSLIAGLALATYVVIDGERRAADTRRTARGFDLAASRLLQRLREIGAGQQAYVAPGQDPAWWRKRVTAELATVQPQLDRLRESTTDPGALTDLDAAAAGAEALRDVDARIGRVLADHEKEQAASLVYGEALATAADVARQIELARDAELQTVERTLERTRLRAGGTAAAAALLAVIVAIVLLPTGGGSDTTFRAGSSLPSETALSEAKAQGAVEPVPALPSPAVPPLEPVREAPLVSAPTRVVETPPVGRERPETARERRKAPELRAAADLCTDFARLVDGHELPALLERASRLLDATGLIVWMADLEGTALRPVFAHGYTAPALSRLPAIPRDADNATAAAYRASRLEVVKTNGMSPGAIVAPLIGPSGCLGVVAAEVRLGREASESARALARIVAAQLATLVSITPRQEQAPAQSAVG